MHSVVPEIHDQPTIARRLDEGEGTYRELVIEVINSLSFQQAIFLKKCHECDFTKPLPATPDILVARAPITVTLSTSWRVTKDSDKPPRFMTLFKPTRTPALLEYW